MDIKPVRTAADHARALKEIEALWDKAKPGTAEGARFDVLATLIDVYESEHFAIGVPDPIRAIKLRMEEKELSARDLLPIFGTTARISEVLNKKRGLSLEMIRELHARLDIPLEVLVRRYRLKGDPKARKRKAA